MTEFNKLGLSGVNPATLDFDPNAQINQNVDTTGYSRFSDKSLGLRTQPNTTSFNIGDSFLNNNPEVRGMLGINNNLGSTEPASTFDNANFINSDIAPEFQDLVTQVGTSYGKDTTVIDAQERINAGVAMPGDLDIVNATTNKTTSVPDLSNPNVLNNIAIDTAMPTVKEGIYGMRKDVATPETTRDIKNIQDYKRNPDLQFNVNDIMELDVGQRLGEPQIQSIFDMVQAPGQTPFLAADGGLASMFTRRR